MDVIRFNREYYWWDPGMQGRIQDQFLPAYPLQLARHLMPPVLGLRTTPSMQTWNGGKVLWIQS
jgi:hypothetical protein